MILRGTNVNPCHENRLILDGYTRFYEIWTIYRDFGPKSRWLNSQPHETWLMEPPDWKKLFGREPDREIIYLSIRVFLTFDLATHTGIQTIFFHMTLTAVEGISLVSSKSLLLTQKVNYKIFKIWSRIWIPHPRLPSVKLYKISLVSSNTHLLTQKVNYMDLTIDVLLTFDLWLWQLPANKLFLFIWPSLQSRVLTLVATTRLTRDWF
jgi:hypothetical protein